MITAPKRRLFRFSLRALFVVVTIFACWLGWFFHMVHERHAMRKWIEERGGEVRSGPSGVKRFEWEIDGPMKPMLRPDDWRRNVFDYVAFDYVAEIEVPGSASERDKARINTVFPNATLYRRKTARF